MNKKYFPIHYVYSGFGHNFNNASTFHRHEIFKKHPTH